MASILAAFDDNLTCPICLDLFTEPKQLPCMHRFCRSCLNSYLARENRYNLVCPKCRQPVRFPPPQTIAGSDLADRFPSDCVISSLVEEVKKQKRNAHFCSRHPKTLLDLYCEDCEVCICHICAGVNHRACVRVVSLTEEASKERCLVEKRLSAFKEKASVAKVNHEKVMASLLDLVKDYTESKDRISETYKSLQQLLQESQAKSIKTLDDNFQSADGNLQRLRMTVESYLEDSKQIVSSTENSLGSQSDIDLMNNRIQRETTMRRIGHVTPVTGQDFVNEFQSKFKELMKRINVTEIESLLKQTSLGDKTPTKFRGDFSIFDEKNEGHATVILPPPKRRFDPEAERPSGSQHAPFLFKRGKFDKIVKHE